MYTPVLPPYAHQAEALRRWDSPHWGWLMEMGTGKTKVCLDNFGMLVDAGKIDALVVAAPKGMYANWTRREIPKHVPPDLLSRTRVHLWRGGHSHTERREIARLMQAELAILVVNLEAVTASAAAQKILEEFLIERCCLMAVDESSRIKSPTSMISHLMRRLGRHAPYRRIMTGTPTPHSPLDLWSQFEFLKRGCLGHSSFITFRARYAVMSKRLFGARKRPVDVVIGHRDTDHLAALVRQHATVVRKEDCLDLPPKVYETRDVDLSAEQRRVYDDLERWSCTQLEGREHVSATEAITLLLRLHQISCGHVVDEQGVVHQLENGRLAALDGVLDEDCGPAILWCSYRADVDRVVRHLRDRGLRVVRHDGSTSVADRDAAVDLFQGGQADVFVGTPATGGYGVTLTRARTVVYFSNSYNLEHRLQSEDRPHRIGLDHSVTYIDLVARGTVDERFVANHRAKIDMSEVIMQGGPQALLRLIRGDGERAD